MDKLPLNIKNYFSHFIFNPLSTQLSARDQKIAMVATVALSFLSVGTLPLAYGIYRFAKYSGGKLSSTVSKIQNLAKKQFPIDKASLQVQQGPHKGITDPKLQKIQDEIDIKKLPLHVCPVIPEKSYALNEEACAEYLNLLPEGDAKRKTAEKLFEVAKKQHISMAQLEEGLHTCVGELNQALANKPYSVGLVHGKSNQWVASLALKHLSHTPSSTFSLGSFQGTKNVSVPEYEKEKLPRKQALVLFDDCSWSGKQAETNVRNILKQMKTNKIKTEVYLVIPFMTNQAYKKISELVEGVENFKIITTKTRILTIAELGMSKEPFRSLFRGPYDFVSDIPWVSSSEQNLTMCWTDWRLPDQDSFLDTLMKPMIASVPLSKYNPDTIPEGTKLVENIKAENPEFSKRTFKKGESYPGEWRVIEERQIFPKKIPRPYEIRLPPES